jgi:16S rRNA (guanine527-N7)-methyltransferase
VTVAAPPPSPTAEQVFGGELSRAVRYARLLCHDGVEQGLVGPNEPSRIWERHLVNCAVIGRLIDADAEVVDVGSGAGLPGIPLALARPDLRVTLVEPMQRRVAFLRHCCSALELSVGIVRARGEELPPASADVVVARAVAPLAALLPATVHALRPGGTLLAMKGRSAEAEIATATLQLSRWPGLRLRLEELAVDDETVRVVVAEAKGSAKP